MTLIDGKATAAAIKAEIKQEVEHIVATGGKRPHLAAVLVGHDGGSETYVKNKVLACEACGFRSTLLRFEDDITEDQLLDVVRQLNDDQSVDGFIVQLSSHQRWSYGYRFARLYQRNATWYPDAASAIQYPHQWQESCYSWTQ